MANRCRSCKAVIRWAVSETGRLIPLDAEPDMRGTVRLEPAAPDATVPRAVVVAEPDRAQWAGRLYLAHFASCPFADEHRRR